MSKKSVRPNPFPYHKAHSGEGVDWRWDCSECNPVPDVPLREWRPVWSPVTYCTVCGVEKNLAGYHVWPE